MPITGGTYTVGTGGNYATWRAAFTDCDGQTLISNLTLTQISDVTETAPKPFTLTCGSYIFVIKNDLSASSSGRHRGDPTQGYLTTLNYVAPTASFINLITPTGALQIEPCYFKFYITDRCDTLIKVNDPSGNGAFALSHDNLVVNGNGYGKYMRMIGTARGVASNCVINNMASILEDSGSSYAFHMVTVYGGVGFTDVTSPSVVSLYNCATFVSGACYGTGYTHFDKCASQDLTGSEASLRSLSATDCFASLTSTDPTFLDIKVGGPLWKTGTNSLYATGRDIRYRTRPTTMDNKYSIGAASAWQQQVMVCGNVPI